MNILKIVLAVYLLGWIIYYVLSFKDLDEIAFVAAGIFKEEEEVLAADPRIIESVRRKAKQIYIVVSFFGCLLWPMFLIAKFRKKLSS